MDFICDGTNQTCLFERLSLFFKNSKYDYYWDDYKNNYDEYFWANEKFSL